MLDFVKELAWQLQPVLEVALPAVVAGGVLKHVTKLPNNLIPLVNGALGAGVGALTGDAATAAHMAVVASLGGTGMHQLLKIGTKSVVGKLTGRAADTVNRKVGPGPQVSL